MNTFHTENSHDMIDAPHCAPEAVDVFHQDGELEFTVLPSDTSCALLSTIEERKDWYPHVYPEHPCDPVTSYVYDPRLRHAADVNNDEKEEDSVSGLSAEESGETESEETQDPLLQEKETLEELLTFLPNNFDYLLRLATLLHTKMLRYKESRPYYERAYAISRTTVVDQDKLVILLNNFGTLAHHHFKELNLAKELYESVFEIDPTNEHTINNYCLLSRVFPGATNVEECFQNGLQSGPQNAFLLNNMGILKADQGQVGLAKKYVRRALHLSKGHHTVKENLRSLHLIEAPKQQERKLQINWLAMFGN